MDEYVSIRVSRQSAIVGDWDPSKNQWTTRGKCVDIIPHADA